MLTEFYIETLLVDEELAELVWVAWDAGMIPDNVVTAMWLKIAMG